MPVLLSRPAREGRWQTACPVGDVDVRLVDLDADAGAVARAESCLTPAEWARARRATAAVHRRRVLLRAALRSAVAAELGTDPARVPLRTTAGGRPYVGALPDGTFLDVSCSAGGTLGIVAVSRGARVGVDLEPVTAWSRDVLDERWLSRAEAAALIALPPAARPLAAARCWTQKEAVLKAAGTGLLGDPAATVAGIGRRTGLVAGWRVHDLPVPPGWVATLAVAPEEEPS